MGLESELAGLRTFAREATQEAGIEVGSDFDAVGGNDAAVVSCALAGLRDAAVKNSSASATDKASSYNCLYSYCHRRRQSSDSARLKHSLL